jgi:hypothetical protein
MPMNTSSVAIVTIVVVVSVCLVVWLTAVFRAERHPEPDRRGAAPRRKITGGVFRGDPRQQMPRRDAPAEMLNSDNESRHGE